jgi:hypothetical protein
MTRERLGRILIALLVILAVVVAASILVGSPIPLDAAPTPIEAPAP